MISEDNKHTWCVNAFHGLSADNDGKTKLCCMYRNTKKSEGVLGEIPLLDLFNSKEYLEVRDAVLNGKRHPGCTLCWQEEDAGRVSKRMRDNDKYQRLNSPYEGLAYLELNLGNTCNLSCRTCRAETSSGWMAETYDTIVTSSMTYKEYAGTLKKYHQSFDEESTFWDELDEQLPNIKQFDFYGGEPLMIKKMWTTLRKAVSKGVAKDIELHYNTNGTHFPKDVELWKEFKEVNLSFSIDGIGEQFEYMRYPAKWDHVLENMQKFQELADTNGNMNLSWCITVSFANVFYVPEILEFYYNNFKNMGMYLNLVHNPVYHNIQTIPEPVKDHVIKKLEQVPKEYVQAWQHIPGVINFMKNAKSSSEEVKLYFENTKRSDNYRSQSFNETFSEFAGLINQCSNIKI